MKPSSKVGLVLMISYLVAWLDRMAINMAVPFMAKDLSVGADKVGWILSAFFAGYALCQIPGGLLADRLGPRKVDPHRARMVDGLHVPHRCRLGAHRSPRHALPVRRRRGSLPGLGVEGHRPVVHEEEPRHGQRPHPVVDRASVRL